MLVELETDFLTSRSTHRWHEPSRLVVLRKPNFDKARAGRAPTLPPTRAPESLRGDAAIGAAKVEKWFAVKEFGAFDFTDENGVVSGDVGRHDIAGDVDQRVSQ